VSQAECEQGTANRCPRYIRGMSALPPNSDISARPLDAASAVLTFTKLMDEKGNAIQQEEEQKYKSIVQLFD
jgi:hypothetical protein